MTDITKVYTCKHILDVDQQNEKELILTCRVCPIKMTAEIVSVTIKDI